MKPETKTMKTYKQETFLISETNDFGRQVTELGHPEHKYRAEISKPDVIETARQHVVIFKYELFFCYDGLPPAWSEDESWIATLSYNWSYLHYASGQKAEYKNLSWQNAIAKTKHLEQQVEYGLFDDEINWLQYGEAEVFSSL